MYLKPMQKNVVVLLSDARGCTGLKYRFSY